MKFKFYGKKDLPSPQAYEFCYIQCFFTLQNIKKMKRFLSNYFSVIGILPGTKM